MKINSVLGSLDRSKLGVVTPHEHIFIDLSAFFEERKLRNIENPAGEKVKIEHLGQLNRDPYALKDNLKMDDYETQKKEILRFRKAGGTTIVDATIPGIGRDPKKLAEISSETGINVIMGTGYYVTSTHPKKLASMSEEEVADEMVKELEEGIDGIKAGVIGEIGISEIFDDNERKVLRASAIAHKKTGAGVLVHINPWTTNGIEAAGILLSNGVKPERIAISHIDVENREDYVLKMLEMGVFVEFDNFGKEYFVDMEARRDGYGCFVTDVQRVDFLKKLIEKGYVNQILLSCDVCLKTLLRAYGGWGYDHVLLNIVPMMKEFGISEADIKTMIETSSDYLLEENMTFCADIFLGNHEKKHGLRIEDVVRVTKDGAENLTDYPRKLFEL